MLARNTILTLIPKPCYRTSVQRHIRCCSVLLANQGKRGSPFQLPEQLKTKKIALENKFRNRFPRTAEIVFRVKNGISSLISDSKDMMLLQGSVFKGTRKIQDLSLRELELSYETFHDLKRMVPIIAIFAIPIFGNFIVAFMTYSQPLRFLSPHFWTKNQKVTYDKETHVNRVSVFLPIIEYLEMSSSLNNRSDRRLKKVLESVKKGHAPSWTELAGCDLLFGADEIFSVDRLSSSQLDNLLILHSRRSILLKSFYLRDWGMYLRLVDNRIIRDGGTSKLSSEQLRKYCFQRGANANAMTDKEMRDYLNQWIKFSENLPSNSISLLLHAPAIIGFNHKSNLAVTKDSSL